MCGFIQVISGSLLLGFLGLFSSSWLLVFPLRSGNARLSGTAEWGTNRGSNGTNSSPTSVFFRPGRHFVTVFWSRNPNRRRRSAEAAAWGNVTALPWRRSGSSSRGGPLSAAACPPQEALCPGVKTGAQRCLWMLRESRFYFYLRFILRCLVSVCGLLLCNCYCCLSQRLFLTSLLDFNLFWLTDSRSVFLQDHLVLTLKTYFLYIF